MQITPFSPGLLLSFLSLSLCLFFPPPSCPPCKCGLPAGWLALQAVAFLKTVSVSQDGEEAAAMSKLD